jgi:hypothetical protein
VATNSSSQLPICVSESYRCQWAFQHGRHLTLPEAPGQLEYLTAKSHFRITTSYQIVDGNTLKILDYNDSL